ncbi:MAG: hypothetical protein QME96_17700, partial [Myxococcota bacterium]|nr:hypothetical protein [Myxococcota bacterium]
LARGRPAPPPKEEFRWKPAPIEPRGSCLYDEHVRRTRKHLIAPFAGWLMPLWFKGIAQEHEAVRCGAGLFDVSHMGVLDVAGRDAERFLDLLTTNHVAWLRPGHAHYSYLLDIDGSVVDDILIYRRGPERFMVVVNAANAERDEAWLRAAATGRFLLDRDDPGIEVPRRVEIRDIKDPSAGADRRVDIAIQGPASLDVLAAAAGPGAFRRRIERLGRFEFAEGEIDGAAALVSRTGYTGEDIGFEIYVHPDTAPPLWNRLLDVGAPHCVEIAGLGARDSTRTEAGLPLHGHELAGPHGVSPIEAGYGSFVHLHKPFFVGRRRMTEQAGGPARQIVRFRLSAQGGKMVRPGNVVVAGPRAEYAGVITSSTAVQGRQFGMALVASEFAVPGAVIHVYPLSEKDTPPPARALDAMAAGDRAVIPREGQVLTRFPRRDERTGRYEMASTGETTCAR